MSWYSNNKDLTCLANVTAKVSKASNNWTILWHGTQSSLIKFMTNAKVSNNVLDISRLKRQW